MQQIPNRILTIFMIFLWKELRSYKNYIIAFAIGIVVNVTMFGNIIYSFAPYLVSLVIQVIAQSIVNFSSRKVKLLIHLPEERKDPTFVMNYLGEIVADVGFTHKLFKKHNIKTLGDIFNNLTVLEITEDFIKNGFEMYSEAMQKWYFVQIKYDTGSCNYLVWMQDISQQKRSQQEAETMTLFAMLNPEPVLRINDQGTILQSNTAAAKVFERSSVIGMDIKLFLPSIDKVNIESFIKNDLLLTTNEQFQEKYYRFMLRGISRLGICQIYGSDSTERIQAEQKVQEQKKEIDKGLQYVSGFQHSILADVGVKRSNFEDYFLIQENMGKFSGNVLWSTFSGNRNFVLNGEFKGNRFYGAIAGIMAREYFNEIITETPNITAEEMLEILLKRLGNGLDTHAVQHDRGYLSLLIVDNKDLEVQFSGGYNPLICFSGTEDLIIGNERCPANISANTVNGFNLHSIQCKKGDVLYVYSDGLDHLCNEKDKTTKENEQCMISLLKTDGQLVLKDKETQLKDKMKNVRHPENYAQDIYILGLKL